MTLSPWRALGGALLTVAVAGTALTALATPAPATVLSGNVAGAVTAARATPAPPKVGSCHDLTYKEGAAMSDPDAPISCARPHTSRTIKVFNASRKVVSNPRLFFRAGLKGCRPALAKALGGSATSRALSAYSVSFFAPTKAQVRRGATWVRCDIQLDGGRTILRLPTDATPALGSLPHADGVALCLQVGKRNFYRTACRKRHNYRAERGFTVASKRYPGEDRLLAIARRRCPGLTASRTWFATWPGEVGWASSGRQLVCFDDRSN